MDITQLRTAVAKRGSARRLAKLSGVSPSVISKLRRNGLGSVSYNTVERLRLGIAKLRAEQQAVATLNAQEPATDAADH